MKYEAKWKVKKGKKYHGTDNIQATCLLSAHNQIRTRVAKKYKLHRNDIKITTMKVK